VVGADLIVVGKSARPRHRLIGSVGQRLIRRQAAPVVVVVP
jgi:nucleotide-binding universal stress UspA family protein